MLSALVSRFQIGKSLFDEQGSKIVQGLCAKAKAKGVTLHLPVDFITASKFADDADVSCMHAYTAHKLLLDSNSYGSYTVQSKNNAWARSGTRSSCTARTHKRWKEVKLRFTHKKFQMQEVQNPICKKL